jgi:hypothetical protein
MGHIKVRDKDGNITTWIVNGVDMLETGLASKIQKIHHTEKIKCDEEINPTYSEVNKATESETDNAELLAEMYKAKDRV